MTTLRYSTSTEEARHRATLHALARVSRASTSPVPATPLAVSVAVGQCLRCGALETTLTSVTGARDYSGIGESSQYPIGWGCEFCD